MRPIQSALALGALLALSACAYDTLTTQPECRQPAQLIVQEVQPSSCGLATGSLQVALSGIDDPAGPVQFALNGKAPQAEGLFTDLSAGVYSITASDGVCTAALEVVVENAEGLNATATVEPSACGGATGRISVQVSGAVGAVSYVLEGGAPQTGPDFSGLALGDYQVQVSDASGCALTLDVRVPSEAGFATVSDIISESCAVSGCHAGNIAPDLRSAQAVQDKAERIRTRTSAGTMPPPGSGRSLSDAEREAIACWVDGGATNP